MAAKESAPYRWVVVAASLEALQDLRRTRRRKHRQELDWIDALYRVYLIAIFGAVALALISGAVADAKVSAENVRDLSRHGPAALGLLAVLALAAGLRSGLRGGPLAIEAAEVQHVLLAPVDRGAALRGLAARRLRTAVFVGVIVGAIVGNFAFRRLPGSPAAWIACGAAFGALVPLVALGGAMVASGRRLRHATVAIVSAVLLAWSLADLLLGVVSSPASMLGELGLLPIDPSVVHALEAAVAIVISLAVPALGVRSLAGTPLEDARRRAELAAQLRFAVTLQDLRVVVLLRRQLASETPRRRPWARAPGKSHVVWRRDWQSFMRWPAVRVGRVLLLAAVAGAALCGAWNTTPLVVVAGLSAFVCGLEAVEPFAQEVDHPTRRDLLPLPAARLSRRHVGAPLALLIAAGLLAVATAFVLEPSTRTLEIGLVMLAPSALVAVAAAALSTSNDPYAFVANPGLGYAQTAVPLFVAILGMGGPLLAARAAAQHGFSAVSAAASFEVTMVLGSLIALWWVGRRMNARTPVRA
jgi:hypothetical protein